MIIFFYGENDFKISQKIKELEEKFIREVDTDGQNVFKFTGEKIKIEEISAQIASGSLFSNKKMIFIFDLIKNKEKNIYKELLNHLEKNKVSDSSDIFVFIEKSLKNKADGTLVKTSAGKDSPLNKEETHFYSILQKQKFAQEFKKFKESELAQLIKDEINKNGLKISPKELQLFLAISGDDAWNISNELKKIINFKLGQIALKKDGAKKEIKENDKKISEEDIKNISSGIFSENIFAFTDAISAKNSKLASKILEEQYLAGSEPNYILSMLLRQFKILLQIRDLLDANYNTSKINATLKLHPYIISKGINQAKNFSVRQLEKIINILAETELANRQGSPNIKAIINLLIFNI